MGEQQFWIRVRVRNGGQIIDMHAPVAHAMIEGGTAVRVDANGRDCKPNGEPLNAPKQTATGLQAQAARVETAAKNAPAKVEQHARTKPPTGNDYRRQPGAAK